MNRVIRSRLVASASGIALSLIAVQAFADTVDDSFNVMITIQKTCTISTAVPDMDFGDHPDLSADRVTTVNFEVLCNAGLAHSLGLSAGANAATPGNTSTRRMAGGSPAGFVAYDLFQDSGHNTHWGNLGEAGVKSGTGTGQPVPHTIYGLVPQQAIAPAAGDYLDTVTLTVEY